MSTNDITDVLSHVMECTLLCSAISGVRYSRFALLSHLIECVTICVPVYIGIFAVQGHSTASLVILLSMFFYFAVNFTRNRISLMIEMWRYLEVYVFIQDVLS